MTLVANITCEPRGNTEPASHEYVVRLAGHEIFASGIRGAAINVAVKARGSIPGLQAVTAERLDTLGRRMTRLAAEKRVDEVFHLADQIHDLGRAYRAAVVRAQRELDAIDRSLGRVVPAGLAAVPPAWRDQPEPPEAA